MSPKPSSRARSLLAIALAFGAASFGCRLDESVPLEVEERWGAIDARRIVAIGDDFVAGSSDGALYLDAQTHSPAALLAAHLSGSAILQPLVSAGGLSLGDAEEGKLRLVDLVPLELARDPAGSPLVPSPPRPFDNLGTPGALVTEALVVESTATSALGNPFYDIVLGGRGTFVEQAGELDPTLVLLWIGTSDVLRYVLAGGDSDLAPGLPTPVGTFALAYEELLESVMGLADQVVLFTIPDLRDVPLARAIPGIVRDPVTGLPVIITVIEPVIDPVTGQPVVDPITGDTLVAQRPSTVPLLGPAGPVESTDLILLTAQPLLAEGIGVPSSVGGTGQPLPDSLVLNAAEQGEIGAAIVGYNQVITALAAEHDLPLVDVHALVERLTNGGIVSDGVRLTGDYAGQAFSLDGATFTPKGYGVVANLVIDALNLRYGGSVPHLRTDVLPGTPLLAFPSPTAP